MLPRASPAAALALLAAPALADVHVAAGGPVAVPDVGSASLAVAVPDDVLVRDVDVLVRLAHPALADVSVTLRHPDGSTVALANSPAASGELFLACFDDEAAAPLAGAVPSAGSFQPAESLAQLDGKRTFGTWTLTVADGAIGSTGALGGFALAFDGRTYVSTDVPKPIPDFAAVLSTIEVPHAFTVLDAEVGVDLQHEFLADVDGRVQGPGAFTPVLFQSLSGLGPASGMTLCALDDESPLPIGLAGQPYTGRFAPSTPGALSALDGSPSQGTWYLNLQDTQFEDDGALLGWWLHLVTDELPPPTEPCVWQQVLDHPSGFSFDGDVELAGGRLFVGVPQGSALGGGSGEVHVHERDPLTGAWTLVQTLHALGGKGNAHFGAALAADGERLAVGAPGADGGAGNVTVFERVGGAFVATAELALPGAQQLGRSVDLDGDRLAAGSVRRADVLELRAGTWTPVLQASGGAQASFGEAVALAGEELLVGRPSTSGAAPSAVVVHALAGGPPVELVPSQVQPFDGFGERLAASGDAFASGAPGHDGPANATGIAYVFRRGPAGWVEEAALAPPGLAAFASLGRGVALVGDTLWASATGAVPQVLRRYERGASAWVLAETLAPPPATNTFGQTLAASADWIVAGAQLASEAYARPVASGALTSCTRTLSLSAGGAQELALAAGAAHAGDLHVLLGSASGSAPALGLGPVALPLVPDAYTLFALGSPGLAPLAGAIGTLDAVGRADAAFALPAGSDPSLAGLELVHAFLVLDAATAAVELASSPLGLRLVP